MTTRKLELSAAKGLLSMVAVTVLATDRKQDLPDSNTGTSSLGLSKSTPHSSLEPISPSTRKHLVNTQNMEGVHPHSQMESILAGVLGHVLVASDTGSFQGLARHVLLLPTHEVNAEGELVDAFLLHPDIVDSDLGIGDTAAKAGLRVGFVLDLAVTPCRS